MTRVNDLFSDYSKTVANLKEEIYDEVGRNYDYNRLNMKRFIQKVEELFQKKVFDSMDKRLATKPAKYSETDWKKCLKAVAVAKMKARIMRKIVDTNFTEYMTYTRYSIEDIYTDIIRAANINVVFRAIRFTENILNEIENKANVTESKTVNCENNGVPNQVQNSENFDSDATDRPIRRLNCKSKNCDLELYFNEFLMDDIKSIEQTKHDLYKVVIKSNGPNCFETKSFFNEVELILDKNIYNNLNRKFDNVESKDLGSTKKLIDEMDLVKDSLAAAKEKFKRICMACAESWPQYERFIRWTPQDIYRYVISSIGIEDLFNVVAATEQFFNKLDAYSSKILYNVQEAEIFKEENPLANADQTNEAVTISDIEVKESENNNLSTVEQSAIKKENKSLVNQIKTNEQLLINDHETASKTVSDSGSNDCNILPDFKEVAINNEEKLLTNQEVANEVKDLTNTDMAHNDNRNAQNTIWETTKNFFWNIVTPFLPN